MRKKKDESVTLIGSMLLSVDNNKLNITLQICILTKQSVEQIQYWVLSREVR
jgi:hypothetical protein